uniref:Uncharacterized protein n=1 Tax=Ananas comosus var. bracteatus TaxID=296719 RepID=A0A6V7PB13_ANACO|nr:unnamed protein product [Ananas comosus var. bracteatus]
MSAAPGSRPNRRVVGSRRPISTPSPSGLSAGLPTSPPPLLRRPPASRSSPPPPPPRPPGLVASAGTEEAELQPPAGQQQGDATPEDLENVRQIQRVLELLKKNRDMLFGELTIMIEDPRDIERKRLLALRILMKSLGMIWLLLWKTYVLSFLLMFIGTQRDITGKARLTIIVELISSDIYNEVNEGRIPENRNALRLLAKEMTEWPDLELKHQKRRAGPNKSLYAKATDTGVDPKTAAKRLNVDWDSAADIESDDEADDIEVPPAVGYGALYLVTALPLVIGISVVLILFYNSLQ